MNQERDMLEECRIHLYIYTAPVLIRNPFRFINRYKQTLSWSQYTFYTIDRTRHATAEPSCAKLGSPRRWCLVHSRTTSFTRCSNCSSRERSKHLSKTLMKRRNCSRLLIGRVIIQHFTCCCFLQEHGLCNAIVDPCIGFALFITTLLWRHLVLVEERFDILWFMLWDKLWKKN